MANGLLGAIANPQIADVAGALQARQQREAQAFQLDQAKQQALKQQQINQAVNDIFAQRFTGKLADLSKMDAQTALQVAQATGIPVDQKGRIAHWFGTAQTLNAIMKGAGPQSALDFLNTERSFLNAVGMPTPRMDAFAQKIQADPLSAAEDLAAITQSGIDAGFLRSAESMRDLKPQQKTGSFLVKDPNTNEVKLVTGVFDPNTGKLNTAEATFGGGQIVSQLGETAAEQTQRRIAESTDKEAAKREIELETAEKMSTIIGKRKRNEQLTEIQVDRLNNYVEAGLNAVDQLANVNRGLELLKTVKTGGLTAMSKTVTDFFGNTSGNVAELNNILASNVLAGLSVFKGALSDPEREFIERMETNLSQGTEFNIRQLSRLQNTLEKKVNIAKDAAKANQDNFSLNLLNEYVSPTGYGPARVRGPASPPPQTTQQPGGANNPRIQQIIEQLKAQGMTDQQIQAAIQGGR